MKITKLAGIDIGSNSIRLLISNVINNEGEIIFKKSSLTRLPIRLGADVFENGKISDDNLERLVKGMQAYRAIMDVYGVEVYRACATSAMREAENGKEVIAEIAKNSNISIELIDGKEEAQIIFNSGLISTISSMSSNFLYMDVGGGSTEFTLFSGDEIRASRSFKIGTIRLLKNRVDETLWQEMEEWIKEKTAGLSNVLMVGSGGNINRTFKMTGLAVGNTLSVDFLEETYQNLMALEPEQRMLQYDLNPDRADVITHALRIYLSAMRWATSSKMLVPKKGLADGMVRNLYNDNFAEQHIEL